MILTILLSTIVFAGLLCAMSPSIATSIWSPLSYFCPQLSSQQQIARRSEDKNSVSCPSGDFPEQFDTTKRVQLGKGIVRGFPSTGGILLVSLNIAVATHLNIPRLAEVERAADPGEEDKFCNQLRLLGAKWWKDELTKARTMMGIEGYEFTPEQRQVRIVGWPSDQSPGYGGVWILRAATPRHLPEGCGTLLSMCINMDERCDLLKQWNATFYEDPAAVPEFAEVFGGGTKGPVVMKKKKSQKRVSCNGIGSIIR